MSSRFRSTPVCTTRQFCVTLFVVAVILNLALWSPLSSNLRPPVFLPTICQRFAENVRLVSKRPLLILHWTDKPGFYFHVDDLKISGCPVSSCEYTSNRSLLPQADAVMFQILYMNSSDMPARRLPHQRWVLVTKESPYRGAGKLRPFDGMFNLMATYARDADVVFPYGRTLNGKQGGHLPPFNRSRG